MRRALLIILLTALASPAIAQDKDDQREREDAIFGETAAPIRTPPPPKEDPLEIGGMLYMRFDAAFTDSLDIADHALAAPTLLDIYLDARPNDRLRAFVRGRLRWDPTVTEGDTDWEGNAVETVDTLLDELWLKFDLGRTVFVTLGQAHVRWGATRIWNPVDVINTQRKVPLTPFDERTGIPQLKLHLPIESLGWNLMAIALLDEADSFDDIGAALRAEIVFSTVELGLTGALRRDVDPKAGVDLSAGVGDVDVGAEFGMRFGDDSSHWAASASLEYALPILDNDSLILGAEYFHQPDGFDSLEDAVLLGLESLAEADESASYEIPQPFYTGKHYGALFMMLPGPGNWDHTNFTLSTIGNLSDLSFLTRLDVSTRALTWLTVQTYVQGHYGNMGELRPGRDAFGEAASTVESFGVDLSRVPVAELGLYLRMAL
jgi:hypothetical protein